MIAYSGFDRGKRPDYSGYTVYVIVGSDNTTTASYAAPAYQVMYQGYRGGRYAVVESVPYQVELRLEDFIKEYLPPVPLPEIVPMPSPAPKRVIRQLYHLYRPALCALARPPPAESILFWFSPYQKGSSCPVACSVAVLVLRSVPPRNASIPGSRPRPRTNKCNTTN